MLNPPITQGDRDPVSHQRYVGNPDEHLLQQSGRKTSNVLKKEHRDIPVTEGNVFTSGGDLPEANVVITKSEFQNFVASINSSFTSMQRSINKLQQGEERGKIEEKLDVAERTEGAENWHKKSVSFCE